MATRTRLRKLLAPAVAYARATVSDKSEARPQKTEHPKKRIVWSERCHNLSKDNKSYARARMHARTSHLQSVHASGRTREHFMRCRCNITDTGSIKANRSSAAPPRNDGTLGTTSVIASVCMSGRGGREGGLRSLISVRFNHRFAFGKYLRGDRNHTLCNCYLVNNEPKI